MNQKVETINKVTISVIIPAYNCEKTINKCVKSIITQSKQVNEIIIINDGSSDKTHFNIDELKKKYNLEKYILLFPFCSTSLPHKKWPYYNELISLIEKKYPKLKLITAPGPEELNEAKNINALPVVENNRSISLTQLAGLINEAKFIISNDTGPAHMSAHLGAKGIALFGYHTTPEKVSMETENFKTITKNNLKELSANEVFNNISEKLSLI